MKKLISFHFEHIAGDEADFDIFLHAIDQKSQGKAFSANTFTIWDTWEEDMKEVSSRFPDLVVRLCGFESGFKNVWQTFFKNGEMKFFDLYPCVTKFDSNMFRD